MLLVGVDDAGPIIKLTTPAGVWRRRGLDVEDRPAVPRIGGEWTAGGAALDPAHDEERALQLGAAFLKHDRLGGAHTLAGEGADGQEFRPAISLDKAAGRIAPQDEALAHPIGDRVVAIGFPARPAGNARQVLHRGRRPAGAGEISRQPFGQGDWLTVIWRSRASR